MAGRDFRRGSPYPQGSARPLSLLGTKSLDKFELIAVIYESPGSGGWTVLEMSGVFFVCLTDLRIMRTNPY